MPTRDGQYEETLTVPGTWWLLGALLTVTVFWVFVVATPLPVALVAGLGCGVLVILGLRRYGDVRVAVDPDGFSAGRALLPFGHVGAVQALDEVETRRLLGVDADARAHLVVRTYCRSAVRVAVDDPDDATPYWLVSTRHPERLAPSLAAKRVQD